MSLLILVLCYSRKKLVAEKTFPKDFKDNLGRGKLILIFNYT